MFQTENSGSSPTAASSVETLGSRLGVAGKLVRQHSVREENLTPEIVIIKNGTLSRSCTEETEKVEESGEGGTVLSSQIIYHSLTVRPGQLGLDQAFSPIIYSSV